MCIGDRYRVGSALFEVTQPCVTSYRVGIRMNEPQMAALLASHDRPGFYFRVLEEGEVKGGDEVERVMRGPGTMTVAEVNASNRIHTEVFGTSRLSHEESTIFSARSSETVTSCDVCSRR